jgi:hypothetical protein
MKKKIIQILIFSLITFIFIEGFSFLMIQFKLLPRYLPPVITLYADENFSFWHPKNKTYKISTICWESEVTFNDIGLKSKKNYNEKKIMPRIGLIGDSMIENIQVSNDEDFSSKLQNLLKGYEIINFSVASTGLADQIEIYDKLAKNFELDYVFLFITDNDFSDNFYLSSRPNRISFKVENEKIIKIERNSEFFKNYFSYYNNFKRKYLTIFKELNTFKYYFYMKEKLDVIRFNKYNNLNFSSEQIKDQYLIYSYLANNIINKIDDDKLFVFLNIKNDDFKQKNLEREMIKEIWKNKVFDPIEESKLYLKQNKIFKQPYLGHNCDAHYSKIGADFLSSYVHKIFINNNKKIK